MIDKNIKPIPQQIKNKILNLDKRWCLEQKGASRLYSYLTKIKGELVKITVAVKSKAKVQYIKQVAVHGVKSKMCLIKDLEYNYMGYGFRVGWYAECLTKHKKWFEDGNWCSAEFKYYNPHTVTINLNYLAKIDEYKYSAYQYFNCGCIIKYLRIYEKYPQTEYLLKLGLYRLHNSVMVLKRIAKDKRFCKWLIANKEEILKIHCYVNSILQAYKTNKLLVQVQKLAENKKRLDSDSCYKPIKELFKGKNLERFFLYLECQKTGLSSYLDYLNACSYLKLDMSLVKNMFPHNFKRWHDIRIDEYHTAKAVASEKEKLALYAKFSSVANKYLALQKVKKTGFAVVIATSPKELLHEGELLNHCVGKMNYDQKFIREETLIFFVRNINSPTVPFVTLEYSLKTKKVLQCYGLNSKKPDDSVLNYVHKVWQPYANRTIKKINFKEMAA